MRYVFLCLFHLTSLCALSQVRDFTQKSFNCDSIPKAFTPNGDGVNDLFSTERAFAAGFEADSFSLRIFNRWGELLFETNDIRKTWDGQPKKKKPRPEPEELCMYLLRATDRFGERVECKGSLLILRE